MQPSIKCFSLVCTGFIFFNVYYWTRSRTYFWSRTVRDKNCKRLISIKKPQITFFLKSKRPHEQSKAQFICFKISSWHFHVKSGDGMRLVWADCQWWTWDHCTFSCSFWKLVKIRIRGCFGRSGSWNADPVMDGPPLPCLHCCWLLRNAVTQNRGKLVLHFEIQRWKFDVKISMGMILTKGCFGQSLPRMLQLKIRGETSSTVEIWCRN